MPGLARSGAHHPFPVAAHYPQQASTCPLLFLPLFFLSTKFLNVEGDVKQYVWRTLKWPAMFSSTIFHWSSVVVVFSFVRPVANGHVMILLWISKSPLFFFSSLPIYYYSPMGSALQSICTLFPIVACVSFRNFINKPINQRFAA